GHGLPARHPARASPSASETADAVLLGHAAAADRGAVAGDAEESGHDFDRAKGGAGHWHHAIGLSRIAGSEAAIAGDAAEAPRDPERNRLHAHEAPRQPRLRAARAPQGPRGPHPWKSQPGPAHRRSGRIQERSLSDS